MSKNRLGKGLGALIGSSEQDQDITEQVQEVKVDQIEPNPFQPRKTFDQDGLEELARSIRENGLLQPITLRKHNDNFQLISGERRWRAAGLAGLDRIPAIIREVDDRQMMEFALIENLQREDLNPMEEARAYRRMFDEFDVTQEELAARIGKSRSSIANTVRLLNLPPAVQDYVSRETIAMGHARALLALNESAQQIKAANYVVENELSVRETERYVQQLKNLSQGRRQGRTALEPEWVSAGKRLSAYLGTRVKIKKKEDKRLITIECRTIEDIQKLLNQVEADQQETG